MVLFTIFDPQRYDKGKQLKSIVKLTKQLEVIPSRLGLLAMTWQNCNLKV